MAKFSPGLGILRTSASKPADWLGLETIWDASTTSRGDSERRRFQTSEHQLQLLMQRQRSA
jgi:hypothetical protein